MSYQRIDRISEQVRREVDRIVREDLSDPRVRGTFSITRADVTRDLRYAKIYVSILEEENRKPMLDALKKAAGYIRRELGHSMIIRYAPELLFELDQNIAYGIHIASVLKQVHAEDDEANEEEQES
ncbi:MAG: 30S ribosome-binding factor RbfA [Clostridiales bacterium]|nr:30S ribosome-binding factor RbfA [Clostridiales bacterium]